tara:strand:- start:4532 stop:4654 length:123 start_codon:yes stop_codon:yes gene_type:complete
MFICVGCMVLVVKFLEAKILKLINEWQADGGSIDLSQAEI